jgi:hypothetical protein
MKTLARVGAVLSFTFCLLAGAGLIGMVVKAGFGSADGGGILYFCIGLYFIGKAFFVGPMLWLAATKCCSKPDGK